MEQVRSNGEQKELHDEIVDLGTRYGIVTPYTSYLATETVTVTSSADITNFPVPVARGSRGGVSGNVNMQPAAKAPMAADARTVTGAIAVQQSKKAREQQEAERVDKDGLSSAVKAVGGKTFYLRDNVWTDAEFKSDARLPETSIAFGSDEYFALLKQKPALARFFSLGERMVVVFEGRVYRVTAGKP